MNQVFNEDDKVIIKSDLLKNYFGHVAEVKKVDEEENKITVVNQRVRRSVELGTDEVLPYINEGDLVKLKSANELLSEYGLNFNKLPLFNKDLVSVLEGKIVKVIDLNNSNKKEVSDKTKIFSLRIDALTLSDPNREILEFYWIPLEFVDKVLFKHDEKVLELIKPIIVNYNYSDYLERMTYKLLHESLEFKVNSRTYEIIKGEFYESSREYKEMCIQGIDNLSDPELKRRMEEAVDER